MPLKILMLGWEYPPHIAGGLGIACHGLSESLHEEGVQITFVVPHLNGEEDASRIKLVSVSAVNVGLASQEKNDPETSNVPDEKQNFKTVFVESALSPYNLAHVSGDVTSFEHWNNEIFTTVQKSKSTGTAYQFKGGYGKGLLDEVRRYAIVVEEIARTSDFDIIHAHDWMTYPAGLAASRATGKPLIIHVHATEFDRAGDCGSKAVYDIERTAVEQCDQVIAVSNWTSEILISKYNADRSKIRVVHNGVFPDHTRRLREVNPVGDKIVTFLGRVTFQKGPEYFVEAARKVLKEFPDTHFVMAGSGDSLPQTIQRVAHAGMSSNFHFTGFLKKEDIDRLLSFSNVYVMPSVSEPFGITPLEAIQAHVPVIISKQSGVSEVVPHALKVDFWDTDALAQSICSILRHKSLATTLQKNALANIESISWHSAAKKIKRLYYETIHAE